MNATVKSDYWGNNYAPITEKSTIGRQISRLFKSPAMRKNKALVMALLGAAPGANATVTTTRVQQSSELGGKRVIETVPVMNRNTTAGDVAELLSQVINHNPRISTPADRAKRA